MSETHVGDVGDAEQRDERKCDDDSDMDADRPNTPATTTLYFLSYSEQAASHMPPLSKPDLVCLDQGGYIFYAGASLAGVSCRRRWPRLLLLS